MEKMENLDKVRHVVGKLSISKGRAYQIAVKEVLNLVNEVCEEAYKQGKADERAEMRENE